jgi:hypothetical protein
MIISRGKMDYLADGSRFLTRIVGFTALVWSAACANHSPANSSEYWATKDDDELSSSLKRLHLIQLRVVGDESVYSALKSFGGAAVRIRDGLVAISDYATCSIIMIHPESDDAPTRVGGCDARVGVLQNVTALQFRGDTLVAYERTRDELVWLSERGVQYRRLRLHLVDRRYLAVGSFHPLSDSEYVFVLHARSTPEMPLPPLAAIVDVRHGTVVRRFLRDAPISATNSPQISQTIRLCASDAKEPQVVALNMWRFQVAFLGTQDSIPARSRWRELAWAHPRRRPAGPGLENASAASLVCDSQSLIAFHPRYGQEGKTLVRVGGWLEWLSFNGEERGALDMASDSVFRLGRPEALGGDVAVFMERSGLPIGAHPVARIARLVLEESER